MVALGFVAEATHWPGWRAQYGDIRRAGVGGDGEGLHQRRTSRGQRKYIPSLRSESGKRFPNSSW